METQKREEEEIHQVEVRTGKLNREIKIAATFFIVMFLATIGYFSYYIAFQSKSTIDSKYNARMDTFNAKIVRGSIIDKNGEILAVTDVSENGQEVRSYPYGNLFAHVIGYTGAGKTGIEASMNSYLLNSSINMINQVTNEIDEVKNPGDNVVTTLDARLQKLASDALGDYRGACVIMEPKTGKILAMVSKPDYNPETINDDWAMLTAEENDSAALLNRASLGLYPPGSTFKLLTSLEYIRENPLTWMDYRYTCEGSMTYGDSIMSCYEGHKHGDLDLRLSLANSCNTSFGTIGKTIDGDSFHELCESFLFNQDMPVRNVKYSSSSFVLNGQSGLSEFVQTSIGQGRTMISPLHNAMIVSSIANGGLMMSPYLVDHVESADGTIVKQFMPEIYSNVMNQSEAATLKDFMVAVVNEGTSPSLQSERYQVAGKTGSAEFDSNKENSHAWFVGFLPADDPELVISIVFENGGLGGSVATKAAKQIFETYYDDIRMK